MTVGFDKCVVMRTNHPSFTYTVWALRWHYTPLQEAQQGGFKELQAGLFHLSPWCPGLRSWCFASAASLVQTMTPGEVFEQISLEATSICVKSQRGLGTAITKLRGANHAWSTQLPFMRGLAVQRKEEQWMLFALTLARTLPCSPIVLLRHTGEMWTRWQDLAVGLQV